MRKMLLIAITLCFATGASATVVDYGWEDNGTVLNVWPDPALPSIIATNVPAWEDYPVHSGNFDLMLEDNDESGTPQVYLVYLWFIAPDGGSGITRVVWATFEGWPQSAVPRPVPVVYSQRKCELATAIQYGTQGRHSLILISRSVVVTPLPLHFP